MGGAAPGTRGPIFSREGSALQVEKEERVIVLGWHMVSWSLSVCLAWQQIKPLEMQVADKHKLN